MRPGMLGSLEELDDKFEERVEEMPLYWGRRGEGSIDRKSIVERCTFPTLELLVTVAKVQF